MKYLAGNFMCLNDARIVYIFSVDEKEQKCQVSNIGKGNNLFSISEDDILCLLLD